GWALYYRAPTTGTYSISIATSTDSSGISGGSFVLGYVIVGKVTRATAAGHVRIVHNVLKAGTDERAIINLAGGTPGGTASLSLFSTSGHCLGLIKSVVLDGNGGGLAVMPAAQIARDGAPSLKTGVYWVVATGAVKDRQPLMI